MWQLDDRRWNRSLNYIQLPKHIIQGQTTESNQVFAWHRIFHYSLRFSLFQTTYIYIHMSDGLIDSMHMKLIAAVIEICSNYWQPIQFHNTAPKFNIALENRPSQKETSSSKLHLTGLSWSSGVQTAWMLCLMMLASFQSYPSTGFRTFLLEKMLCAAGAYSASGLLWWWSAAAGRNLCFIVPLSFPSVPYHNRVLFQHVVALCSSIRSKNVWTHVFQHSSSSHPKHGNGRVWRIYHKRITYKDSINISE